MQENLVTKPMELYTETNRYQEARVVFLIWHRNSGELVCSSDINSTQLQQF
jgi:hypothetical protein